MNGKQQVATCDVTQSPNRLILKHYNASLFNPAIGDSGGGTCTMNVMTLDETKLLSGYEITANTSVVQYLFFYIQNQNVTS